MEQKYSIGCQPSFLILVFSSCRSKSGWGINTVHAEQADRQRQGKHDEDDKALQKLDLSLTFTITVRVRGFVAAITTAGLQKAPPLF